MPDDIPIGRHTILIGDVRDRLRDIPDNSVHCVVTSPPYFGLRDYGTAKWDGGDLACDHIATTSLRRDSPGGFHNSTSRGTQPATKAVEMQYTRECKKCGATRVDNQIGLEPTLAEFIATMVDVFREVRRVLRPDGTCWLNIGSSYAGGGGYSPDSPSNVNGSRQSTNAGSIKGRTVGSNFTNALQRFVKGRPLVIGNAGTIRVTGKRRDVPLHHDGLPKGVLLRLLGVERVTIKQRDNDFCQVLHTLDGPRDCWLDVPVCFVRREATNLEIVVDAADDLRIVISDLNARPKSELTVLRSASAGSCKDDKRPLTIEQAGEPIPKVIDDGEAIGNAIAFDAPLKRFPDVYLVDKPVALGDRLDAPPGDLSHFRVTQAGCDQLSLTLGNRRVQIVPPVRHLYSLNAFGSLVRYAELYDKATKEANALQPKQDLGVPWRLAIALQEDGWILRSPIIWHKKAPMPESVTDRPTSAHEHIFLLAKNARYYYDADAVREEPTREWWAEARGPKYMTPQDGRNDGGKPEGDGNPLGRNSRNVWTLGPEPFPEAHFATFPTEIPRRAIKAGTSERGVCASCGAPWVRQVSEHKYTPPVVEVGVRNVDESRQDKTRKLDGKSAEWRQAAASRQTTGWAPSCACEADAIPATVLDPFLGSGTTMLVADQLGRTCVGVELNPEYARMAEKRVRSDAPLFVGLAAD